MTLRIRLGLIGLVVATAMATVPLRAEEAQPGSDIDPALRTAIVKLFDKTNVMAVTQQLYDQVLAQLLPAIERQSGVNDEKVDTIMKEEMSAAFKRHLGDFKNMMVAAYATYYTKKDIDAMNAFYDTPTGQKVIATTPQLTQQSMKAGQIFGRSFAGEAMANVKKRLDALKSQKSD